MLTWLANELIAAGLQVVETTGWATRQTRPGFEPQGLVLHDTVTPATLTRTAEQGILINGRPDLAGPLSQLGLHRDGVISVIAAGRCSHNGFGTWGNDSVGLEVFCYGAQAGHEEPYNAVQREVAAIWSAVVCRHFGWGPDRVKGHKETDPTRKRDPFGVDMVAMRGTVGALLNPQEDDLTPAQAAQLATIETICRAMLQANWAGGDLSWLDVRISAVLAAVAGISVPGGVVDVEALADALKGALSAELAADLAARLAA